MLVVIAIVLFIVHNRKTFLVVTNRVNWQNILHIYFQTYVHTYNHYLASVCDLWFFLHLQICWALIGAYQYADPFINWNKSLCFNSYANMVTNNLIQSHTSELLQYSLGIRGLCLMKMSLRNALKFAIDLFTFQITKWQILKPSFHLQTINICALKVFVIWYLIILTLYYRNRF